MADEKTHTKADIDAAVAAAVAKVQDSIDKLETKNAELLDEKKAAERKLRTASEIKPEHLTAAEERADKAEAELAKAQKAAKDATAAAEKATKALETESAFTQRLLIQDGLKSALIENGVKDSDFIDSLTAKFAPTATITVDGDKREAKIGDKSLAAHIKEWAGSESGKKFVAAPANSGGGAGGDGGVKSDAKTMTRTAYNALDQMGKAALGPQMAKGELKLVDDAA